MPTSDYPFVRQLHADRTARIVRGSALRLPRLPRPRLLARRREAALTPTLAPTC